MVESDAVQKAFKDLDKSFIHGKRDTTHTRIAEGTIHGELVRVDLSEIDYAEGYTLASISVYIWRDKEIAGSSHKSYGRHESGRALRDFETLVEKYHLTEKVDEA